MTRYRFRGCWGDGKSSLCPSSSSAWPLEDVRFAALLPPKALATSDFRQKGKSRCSSSIGRRRECVAEDSSAAKPTAPSFHHWRSSPHLRKRKRRTLPPNLHRHRESWRRALLRRQLRSMPPSSIQAQPSPCTTMICRASSASWWAKPTPSRPRSRPATCLKIRTIPFSHAGAAGRA